MQLNGYQLQEKRYESENTLVYRAIREEDHLPVIVKTLRGQHPSLDQLNRFRREYQITKSLNGTGVIQAIALEKMEHSLAIILEDAGGESLAGYLKHKKMGLGRKFGHPV